jgi:predicted transcriptional regulator
MKDFPTKLVDLMNTTTNTPSQEYASSVKIDVIYRILEVLCNSGPKKMTNLAMLSGLNYLTCKKYSNLMEILSWVKITKDEKSTVISITETGKKLREKLQTFD